MKAAGHHQNVRKKPVPHLRLDAPARNGDEIAPEETTDRNEEGEQHHDDQRLYNVTQLKGTADNGVDCRLQIPWYEHLACIDRNETENACNVSIFVSFQVRQQCNVFFKHGFFILAKA